MIKVRLQRTRFLPIGRERRAKAKVIAAMNAKGGSGKTSVSLALGIHLIRLGYNVLLWDADTQCNLTQRLGIPDEIYNEARLKDFYRLTEDPKFLEKQMRLPISIHYPYIVRYTEAEKIGRLSVMPGHEHGEIVAGGADEIANHQSFLDPDSMSLPIKTRQAIRSYLDYYDYIIIDTAPALEGSLMCKLALLAADEIVCPVDGLEAAGGLQHLITWVLNTHYKAGITQPPNITFAITKYQADTKRTPELSADNLLKSVVYRTLKEYLGMYVCDSGVKELPSLKGQAFDVTATRSKDVYRELCDEIINKMREPRINFFSYWTKSKADKLKDKLSEIEKESKKYMPVFKEPMYVQEKIVDVRLENGQREGIRYSY